MAYEPNSGDRSHWEGWEDFEPEQSRRAHFLKGRSDHDPMARSDVPHRVPGITKSTFAQPC